MGNGEIPTDERRQVSVYRSAGLSISAFKPTIDTSTPLYTPTGTLITDAIGSLAASYSHTIAANGGYWSASITFSDTRSNMEEWLSQGLNRHIEVYGSELTKVWEGFVNQITYSAGTLSAVMGPLMDISNRASVVYTPILDATISPPVLGVEQSTTIEDDDDSRALYGVLESVLSQGQLLDDETTDEAAQIRDTFLAESAWPQSSEDLALGQSSEPSITLECLGYVHRFSRYVVQDLTATTVQISNNAGTGKLQLAIAEDPNGMFPASYSKMENNGLLTSRYENTNRTAWDVMQQLVGVGDVNDDRYTLGVYNDRLVTYAPIPSDIEYQHRIGSSGMRFERYGSGQEIMPWNIRPARWSFLPDFLTGRSASSTMRRDPRNVFIEQVVYTAPWGIQISGNRIGRLDQKLAKLGMRG